MNKMNLLKNLLEDPQAYTEKILDEKYKKDLGDKVFFWHLRMKQDKSWDEYINNLLFADYQYNHSSVACDICPSFDCIDCKIKDALPFG